MQFELELLDVRKIDDLQRVDRGLHALSFDEVVDWTSKVEEHAFVLVGFAALLAAHERQALERRVSCLAHHQRRLRRLEPGERRRDRLIHSTGHTGIARAHFNPVWGRGLDISRDNENR